MLLLPMGTNKINCEWKGPFPVISVVPGSEVNYVIDINGKHKTYHINMLKEYVTRPQNLVPEIETVCNVSASQDHVSTSLYCSNVSVIDDICDETVCESFSHIELPSLEQTEGIDNVKVNPQLTESQKTDVNNVLQEFSDIFTDVPLITNCIEHEIKLTSEVPIRLKPYPLPFSSEKIVKDEVDSMLKAGDTTESISP